jgi:uncharacterized coiled-coil protein SlyX
MLQGTHNRGLPSGYGIPHHSPMSNRTNPSDLPSPSTGEQRFVSLESHIAELERMADELNKIVTEHGKVIRRLQAQQSQISDTLRTAEIDRIRDNNPKPPHSVL